MASEPRLILFSGLAADARVFAPQRLAFPRLEAPPWPTPGPDETLSAYAERLANGLRDDRPCLLGGASFGGIVALEAARVLRPRAVLLLGSVCSPAELPRRIRVFRPFRHFVGLLPVRAMQWASRFVLAARRRWPHLASVAEQFYDADRDLFRWSVRQILAWREPPIVPCPVLQLHGGRDAVFPLRRTRPDEVVAGAGHVVTLSHPAETNAFLVRAIAKFFPDRAEPTQQAT